MWTSKNRAHYDRSKLRYPSDLTDDEWALVEPLIPPGKTGGGKRQFAEINTTSGGSICKRRLTKHSWRRSSKASVAIDQKTVGTRPNLPAKCLCRVQRSRA
jgi:hypothetical protein